MLIGCMHLVYVTAEMPFGLGETFIVPEILELQRRGHQVTVIPIRPLRAIFHKDARALTTTTIAQPVLSLSIVGNALAAIMRAPTLALRSALLLAASRNLRVLLKNLAVFPKGLWLARVAKREGVDHIHAHFASTSATVALVASIVSGIPWSFTAHRWDISENNLLEKKAQGTMFARAIDARGGQELTTYVGAHQQKLRVIHMGVAVPPAGPEREERSGGPLRVLLGARFDQEKGHRYALEAVARLKRDGVNLSLHCAGHGPLKATIEKYAGVLDVLDRVHFPGLLDHQELLTQLWNHQWDVALLPSLETIQDREGIPVFLIEAMAAGVPVVATKTGGIPELLEGGAGMLIPQRDASAIAEALAKLAADGDLRRQLAEAGIRRVRDQFTIESTVSALLDEISSGTRPARGATDCMGRPDSRVRDSRSV
jgi:colanic acid/amylovoran biosynthesis glycosyltransferase